MDDGGRAFPQVNYAKPADGYGVSIMEIRGGMSLRDWFAGQALAGFMSNPLVFEWLADAMLSKNAERALVAQACGLMADAMLAGRNRKEEAK